MRRGRKNRPCPSYDALRVAHAADPRPDLVARALGANRKQVCRWLGEIGIELLPQRKQRPRGVTPQYVWGANRSSDGKRITCTLYNIWHSMRLRCRTPGYRDYKYYGGRGITICDEWDTYAGFRAWAVSHGFRKHMTIDRENVNGNYEPDNSRWLPQKFQQDNTRRVIKLTLRGVTKALPVWARELGLKPTQIRSRIKQGWTDEQVLTTPMLPGGQWREGVQHKARGRKPRITV